MPKKYVIIENTPGYLPENDDPLTFDSYAEALNHLVEYNKELSEEFDPDGFPTYEVYPIVNGWFKYGFLGSIGNPESHDLGRYVTIEEVEEDGTV